MFRKGRYPKHVFLVRQTACCTDIVEWKAAELDVSGDTNGLSTLYTEG